MLSSLSKVINAYANTANNKQGTEVNDDDTAILLTPLISRANLAALKGSLDNKRLVTYSSILIVATAIISFCILYPTQLYRYILNYTMNKNIMDTELKQNERNVDTVNT